MQNDFRNDDSDSEGVLVIDDSPATSNNMEKWPLDLPPAYYFSNTGSRYKLTYLQLYCLRNEYRKGIYMRSERCQRIAQYLNMPQKSVKWWFKNQRSKDKKWVQSNRRNQCNQTYVDVSTRRFMNEQDLAQPQHRCSMLMPSSYCEVVYNENKSKRELPSTLTSQSVWTSAENLRRPIEEPPVDTTRKPPNAHEIKYNRVSVIVKDNDSRISLQKMPIDLCTKPRSRDMPSLESFNSTVSKAGSSSSFSSLPSVEHQNRVGYSNVDKYRSSPGVAKSQGNHPQ